MPEPLVSTARLRALRSALGAGEGPVLIVIHDYPDPDAAASALAIQVLAGSWGVSSVIAHGGGIGRGENAEMVRLLKIELRAFAEIPDLAGFRGAAFLDTGPTARNQSMPDSVPVLGVIDHHSLGSDSTRSPSAMSAGTARLPYTDVRAGIGANSTLALGYLETAGIVPDVRLATALFLGIKTDTDGLLRNAAEADVSAYVRLLPQADMNLAARIVHPPIEPEQIRFLHRATAGAMIHGESLIAFCGEAASPDRLSAVSDALVGVGGVLYALAVGFNGGRAYLSLRARHPRSDATSVLLRVVGPEGQGGGHGISAGGFMRLDMPVERCLETIRSRFLEAAGDAGRAGERLIPREG